MPSISMDRARTDAVSPIVGVGVLVAVTVLLAAILAAYLFWFPHLCDPFPRAVFQVVAVHDYDEGGTVLNYDSRVLLRNFGPTLPNRPLSAAFYADGVPVPCRLETFNGEAFVGGSIHLGIEKLKGQGCQKETWESGAFLLVDFKARTFMPGKTIRFDVIDSRSGCIISRHFFSRSAVPAR